MGKARLISNFLLFQVGWFACVLGAANGMPWIGPVVVALILAWHVYDANHPIAELRLLLITLFIGGIWDSYMVISGWLVYNQGMFHSLVAPYWILAMWLLFATTLNVSMRWIKGQLILSAVLGGVAGPLAYYAGYRLDAVQMFDPLFSSLVIGVGWFFIMPLLVLVARQHDGFSKSQPAEA